MFWKAKQNGVENEKKKVLKNESIYIRKKTPTREKEREEEKRNKTKKKKRETLTCTCHGAS